MIFSGWKRSATCLAKRMAARETRFFLSPDAPFARVIDCRLPIGQTRFIFARGLML